MTRQRQRVSEVPQEGSESDLEDAEDVTATVDIKGKAKDMTGVGDVSDSGESEDGGSNSEGNEDQDEGDSESNEDQDGGDSDSEDDSEGVAAAEAEAEAGNEEEEEEEDVEGEPETGGDEGTGDDGGVDVDVEMTGVDTPAVCISSASMVNAIEATSPEGK